MIHSSVPVCRAREIRFERTFQPAKDKRTFFVYVLNYILTKHIGESGYSLSRMLGTICGTKVNSALRAEDRSIGPHGTGKLSCY